MKALIFAAGFIAAAPALAADTITTKVPAAHVEAFQRDCQSSGVPQASCWCMVKKFNETKDGAAVLDAVGLQMTKPDDATKKKELLNILNRHGLRPSQLAAILAPSSKFAENVAKQCQ